MGGGDARLREPGEAERGSKRCRPAGGRGWGSYGFQRGGAATAAALVGLSYGELSQILKYDQFGGSAPEKGTATAPSTGPIVARSLT
jgi:hypothetical protein